MAGSGPPVTVPLVTGTPLSVPSDVNPLMDAEQFGIEIPGFKWSPVQYIYKQWADLYENNSQYLYVNRGLGFIGYPGRVGILPEITVFELSHT